MVDHCFLSHAKAQSSQRSESCKFLSPLRARFLQVVNGSGTAIEDQFGAEIDQQSETSVCGLQIDRQIPAWPSSVAPLRLCVSSMPSPKCILPIELLGIRDRFPSRSPGCVLRWITVFLSHAKPQSSQRTEMCQFLTRSRGQFLQVVNGSGTAIGDQFGAEIDQHSETSVCDAQMGQQLHA